MVARRDSDDPTTLVVVVPQRPGSLLEIDRFLQAGVPVLVAPTPEIARAWLPSFDERPPALPPHEVIRWEGLHLDLTEQRAMWNEEPLALTSTELQLLASLARDPGRVWSVSELLASVWATERYGDGECVRSAVKRLRKRLECAGAPIVVESVRGRGYRLSVVSSALVAAHQSRPRITQESPA